MTTSRWTVPALLGLLPAVAVVVSWAVWHRGLPDRVASHWSGLGAADDSLPTMALFTGVLTVVLVAAVVTAVAAFAATVRTAVWCCAVVVVAGTVAAAAAAAWLVPAWLTLRSGSPRTAVLGPWVIPLAASALYGLLPYAAIPRAARQPGLGADGPRAGPSELADLSETETGAWSRTVRAPLFLGIGAGFVALAVALFVAYRVWPSTGPGLLTAAIAVLLSGALSAAFGWLRVSVDRRGLRVVSLPTRIPVRRIPLARVRSAQGAYLQPLEWGGWGYRFAPGRSAIILRAGDGLVVTQTSGRKFAVTLQDPDTPAQLLTGLLTRPGR